MKAICKKVVIVLPVGFKYTDNSYRTGNYLGCTMPGHAIKGYLYRSLASEFLNVTTMTAQSVERTVIDSSLD